MGWVAANGLMMPSLGSVQWSPGSVFPVINATGGEYAIVGRVWNKDHATKSIERVQFCFGNAVVKTGGSDLILSLQDVSLTAGPPYQPDGTRDQTVAIANADAGFAANAWYRTGVLSANRSVAYGERLAVVIGFGGAGRLGSDTVNFTVRNSLSSRLPGLDAGSALKTGGTWAAVGGVPLLLLEFSDGTFGTLDGAIATSGGDTTVLNTGSSPDEAGNTFTVPFPCKVDALWAGVQVASGADFDLVLYNGTTQLASGSIDANAIEALTASRLAQVPIAETVLLPGNTYYVAVKPTTANNVTLYGLDVVDVAHFDAWPNGRDWIKAYRTDAGAWTASDTHREWAGVRISAIRVDPAMLVNNGGLVG
jgi:hypothetical protein